MTAPLECTPRSTKAVRDGRRPYFPFSETCLIHRFDPQGFEILISSPVYTSSEEELFARLQIVMTLSSVLIFSTTRLAPSFHRCPSLCNFGQDAPLHRPSAQGLDRQ